MDERTTAADRRSKLNLDVVLSDSVSLSAMGWKRTWRSASVAFEEGSTGSDASVEGVPNPWSE